MSASHISEEIQRTGSDWQEMQWHFTFAEYKAYSLNQSITVGYIDYRTWNTVSMQDFKMWNVEDIKNKIKQLFKK